MLEEERDYTTQKKAAESSHECVQGTEDLDQGDIST